MDDAENKEAPASAPLAEQMTSEQGVEVALRVTTEACILETEGAGGVKTVHYRTAVPANSGPEETFYFFKGEESLRGMKTGRAVMALIAGDWADGMKTFAGAIAGTLEGDKSPGSGVDEDLVVSGLTIEMHFRKAVERVVGEFIGQEWINDPAHFADALFQTPEIQMMIPRAPAGAVQADAGRKDTKAD